MLLDKFYTDIYDSIYDECRRDITTCIMAQDSSNSINGKSHNVVISRYCKSCAVTDSSDSFIGANCKFCSITNGEMNIIGVDCEDCSITNGKRNTILNGRHNARIENCDNIVLDQDNVLVTKDDQGNVVYKKV
jgi:hypothetical protein